MTENWITLTPEDIASTRADPARGLFYSPSPFNVPTAIRVSTMPSEGRRVIEFQYLDGNEPAVLEPYSGIGLALGKVTHRVFRVFVDENAFKENPDQVIRTITNALLNLRADSPRTRDNLDATSNALSRFGEKLLAG